MLSTLSVVSNADSGPGSLRAELAAAQNGDTIAFAPSLNGQTIGLTSGALAISYKDVNIEGPGATQLAVSGGNVSRVFQILGGPVTISGLSIVDGRGGTGGGIFNGGTLTVNDCLFSDNTATDGGGIYNTGAGRVSVSNDSFTSNTALYDGGGVYNLGTLTASGCTFDHNSAMAEGGGFDNAYYGSHVATLTNCTFADNTAIANVLTSPYVLPGGGGYYADQLTHTTLTNCTLSLNSTKDGWGGGIQIDSGANVRLINTIVAGNTAGQFGQDIHGQVTQADHNLIGSAGGAFGVSSANNILNVNAMLGPLADNGGPTDTMALLVGSPAIGNADNAAAPATDQRGVTRQDVPGEVTDIGAFEL